MHWIEFCDAGERECVAGVRSPGEAAADGEGPDSRVGVVGADGCLLGHAALWWRETPVLEGERLGCIGGFEAADGGMARLLLDAACRRLAQEGCSRAVGPMNGNTWRAYRWVVERGERPPFFLEPWNGSEMPGWWEAAGFSELAGYSSSRVDLRAAVGRDLTRVRGRLDAVGVKVRGVRVEDYESELRAIHAMCLDAFSANFLYTPLGEDEFVEMYGKVRRLVRPEFVLVAEAGGDVCGFVFAVPDALALGRGEPPDLVVKTLAVRAERRFAGLGSVLVGDVQAAAKAAGMSHAIHALQYETNTSLRITRRDGGERMRRYALFSKML